MISPKPSKFKAVEIIKLEVCCEIIEKPDKPCQLWALRWVNVEQNKNNKVSKVIDIEKGLQFLVVDIYSVWHL